MKVLLASRNAKKLTELRRILAATAPTVELVGLDDVPAFPDTPETELSFAGNALLKARDGVRNSGLPTMADDSGLTVDALNGMPGVFSARWSGKHGDDAANLDLMLAQIADVPDEHRGGAFVCAAAFAHPDGSEIVAMGELRGTVLRERRGTGGFGYDPVFVPEGHERTTAELTPQEKDALSHRGRAFRDLAARIVPS
ncbi:RdgB/HAM1 family non-canonical purine NTP pyrophosphatase [Phytomonospora sp. NPDC050363]|uniref:RdgB/HAM1 family non-canonical purine NTP pyrophosphatase n=1 Tax=Phytomonospora sp. NPDC050363 TaxID=3155642 RepID=UPI00340653BE